MEVKNETAQYWPGKSSVIITVIQDVPRFRALHIWLAGGNLAELEAMMQEIEVFARAVGADRITFDGRLGWLRSPAVPYGFRAISATMEKKLGA